MDEGQEDGVSVLSLNDPFSDDWNEESFLGHLMEEGLFSEDGYADLEAAMVGAVADGLDFQTLGAIIRIVERITLMLKQHVDPREEYRIVNLDDEQVAELDKRVRFCLLEISTGSAPDLSRWEA